MTKKVSFVSQDDHETSDNPSDSARTPELLMERDKMKISPKR